MSDTQIRPYLGQRDLDNQYALWLKATEDLPYAWRSNATNARCVSQHAAAYPRARWYAERDGRLVGYIGTHPPVKWDTGEWLMPFGFPWTCPHDVGLEQALYDQMISVAPELYPDSPRATGYVQRFRSSWQHHLDFLKERGWEQRWVVPLLGHAVVRDEEAARGACPLNDDIALLAKIAADDPYEAEERTIDSLKRSFAGGWLEPQSTWIVDGLGAFEMEVRRPWSEVRLLLTLPVAETSDLFWRALSAKAAEAGAGEVYVTVDGKQTARRAQLERRGFRVVEMGVYPVLAVQN